MSAFRAAVAQYPVGQPVSWAEVEATLTRWVGEAVAEGARLLVRKHLGEAKQAAMKNDLAEVNKAMTAAGTGTPLTASSKKWI